jgi:hypothetical protein
MERIERFVSFVKPISPQPKLILELNNLDDSDFSVQDRLKMFKDL